MFIIFFVVLYIITYPFEFVTLLLLISVSSVYLIGTANSLFKFVKLKILLKNSELLKDSEEINQN